MASTAWQRKLEEAQELANRGAKFEISNDYSSAFQCYVRAGELYLWLVKEKAGGSIDTSRLRSAAAKVLSRAETIKQVKKDLKSFEKRPLSDEEQARALEIGSKVDSISLPEWSLEFRQPGPSSVLRPLPSLAPRQVEQDALFKSGKDMPALVSKPLYDTLRPLRGDQITQRVVTDCSFVAALEVAAEHDAKWGTKLAHGPLYPKDEHDYPVWSASDIYNVRLRFNGKDRCISIDDRIPCYSDSTPMCAIGTIGSALQIWPSLLEKAYISLRGGYNFGGSNSSIDLHALTGWIPEQIGFKHAEFQREKTWLKLKHAYDKGHLLVTAGTSREMEKYRLSGQSVLIDLHNYAVLDMKEESENRWLMLMNPWETSSDREIIKMDWNEACDRLDTIYLNWSLDLFRFHLTWHGIWRVDSKQSPVVQLIAKESCDVWLLLTRHSTKSSPIEPTEWIALHIFGSQDESTIQHKSVFVDSTHTLVRTHAKPGSRRIVASRQGGTGDSSFTLFAYSLSQIDWQDIPATTYPLSYPIQGQWTTRTAGGNSACHTFLHNPQYLVSLSHQANVALTVETSKDIPVQVALVWSRGKRVSQVSQGDIVASSGSYNYGLALAEGNQIKAGLYTLIVSSFEKGQVGDFEVRLQSNQPLQVTSIPAEGAGMFHQRIRNGWKQDSARGSPKHSDYFSNPTYQIKVDRSSIFLFRLLVVSTLTQPRPPINIAVFSKSNNREVISSGPYADPVCGVAIEETRLEPGDYSVLVSTYNADVLADFTLDIYSDRKIEYEKIKG